MTGLVVVDSSVAFKWFSTDGETAVDKAQVLLVEQEAGSIVLAAPAHLVVELANALRNSRLEAADVLDVVETLDDLGVELAAPTGPRLLEAVKLTYAHRISVYDALFLSLAEELACPLITADRKAFANIETRRAEIRLI